MTVNGDVGKSVIQTQWGEGERLWSQSHFAILGPPDMQTDSDSMPPNRQFISVPERPSSAELRDRVYQGESIADCVDDDVNAYILRHRLFVPDSRQRRASFCLKQPRLLIAYDERNPKSIALAEKYARYESSTPNLVLVLGGDGTMLRAIREHWQLRVPLERRLTLRL